MILYDSRRVSSYAGVGVSNSFVAVTFVLVRASKSPVRLDRVFIVIFFVVLQAPKDIEKILRYLSIIQSFNLFDYYIKYLKLFSIKMRKNIYVDLIIRSIQLYNNRKQRN